MIMQQANFAQLLNDADLVITGEGRLDGQSLAGKTPIGVPRAKRQGKPVIVLAGSLGDGWQACTEEALPPPCAGRWPNDIRTGATPYVDFWQTAAASRLWLASR